MKNDRDIELWNNPKSQKKTHAKKKNFFFYKCFLSANPMRCFLNTTSTSDKILLSCLGLCAKFFSFGDTLVVIMTKSPRKYGETKWESKAVIKCESEGSFKRAPPSNSIPGDYASSRVLLQVCYIFIDNAIVDNMGTKRHMLVFFLPRESAKKL